MVSAALVAPGHTRVLPLEPEFVEPQDGTEKQDCESRACRRWLAAHGATYAHLKPVYLGDDLYSCQPTLPQMLSDAVGSDPSHRSALWACECRIAPRRLAGERVSVKPKLKQG